MIDTIIAIAKLALAALPFVILCVLSNRINLAEQERSRQFAMPIIALLYAVAGMLLMETINDWLLWLIYAIPGWIAALANVSWMPETVGGSPVVPSTTRASTPLSICQSIRRPRAS